jgi:cell division protein ZapA
MPSYNLTVLGFDISFKTDADEDRVRKAQTLVEKRFNGLNARGTRLSNEKLLIFLALSLADDFLQASERNDQLEEKIAELLDKIDNDPDSKD